MEIIYKGFVIHRLSVRFDCRDYEVWPVGKPEEVEFYPETTMEDIENQLDCLVN